MADITEIIEESAVQLEIVESGGGVIEVVDSNPTIIEVVETSLDSNDLDISEQTNTIVIESSTDNTSVDISTESTLVEAIISQNVIEILENQVVFQTGSVFNLQDWDGQFEGEAGITGSLTIIGNTLTNIGPFLNEGNVTASGNIGSTGKITAAGEIVGQDIVARTSISSQGDLTVSNTIFTDVISASSVAFTGDGDNNILLISSGGRTPITINSDGLIVLDEFTYTPTAVKGGFLFSGSNFFLGLE